MEVKEAINQRRSIRAYLEKPVEREKIEELLTLASKAPSAINLQPWEVVVVAGEERKRLSRLLVKRMKELQVSCAPGAVSRLPDEFLRRQRELFEILSPVIPDGMQFQDFINEGSCNFYGAPVAIIISIDQVFSSARLTDIGIFVGYLLLSAHTLGLGTCPIGLITAFQDEIKEELNIKENKNIVIGVAVGYPDPDAPINQIKTPRVSLEKIVRWRGI